VIVDFFSHFWLKTRTFCLICNAFHSNIGVSIDTHTTKGKFKMTYFNENDYLVFGLETEISGLSVNRSREALRNANINWVHVTDDGTSGVDAEIVFPPMPDCSITWHKVEEVYRCLENAGARINRACGHHIHISTKKVDYERHNKNQFLAKSISLSETSNYPNIQIANECFNRDEMSPELMIDVTRRIVKHDSVYNSMVSESRRNNHFCENSRATLENINLCNTIQDLENAFCNGTYRSHKFMAINFTRWSRGTVEFRKHQGTLDMDKIRAWVRFHLNLFYTSDSTRLDYSNITPSSTDTPIQPFRSHSRVGLIWTMCRSENGSTVQELMNATGTSAINVRARISEMRARFGDDVVVTHSQQANGASYGDGDTHTRYQIRETIQTSTSSIRLLPENRIGLDSLFSGLDDQLFEYLQERIDALS